MQDTDTAHSHRDSRDSNQEDKSAARWDHWLVGAAHNQARKAPDRHTPGEMVAGTAVYIPAGNNQAAERRLDRGMAAQLEQNWTDSID